MYTTLITIGIIVCVIAFIATLHVGKDVNAQIRQYKQNEDKSKSEYVRSQEYEKKSVRSHGRILVIVYTATLVLSIALYLIIG